MELAFSMAFALIVTLLFIMVLKPVALAIGLVDVPGEGKCTAALRPSLEG